MVLQNWVVAILLTGLHIHRFTTTPTWHLSPLSYSNGPWEYWSVWPLPVRGFSNCVFWTSGVPLGYLRSWHQGEDESEEQCTQSPFSLVLLKQLYSMPLFIDKMEITVPTSSIVVRFKRLIHRTYDTVLSLHLGSAVKWMLFFIIFMILYIGLWLSFTRRKDATAHTGLKAQYPLLGKSMDTAEIASGSLWRPTISGFLRLLLIGAGRKDLWLWMKGLTDTRRVNCQNKEFDPLEMDFSLSWPPCPVPEFRSL